MVRTATNEISEHDQLILMMARYFKQQGYTDIKADLPSWTQPLPIYWSNNPDQKYIPDLTCLDTNGVLVILEAETCNTFNDQHTQDQFRIFRAHATNNSGRFEVVVPRICLGNDGRMTIRNISTAWGITIDNIWTPSE
jgi:hypothetical protein